MWCLLVSVSLLCVSGGMAEGWMSPMIQILQNGDSSVGNFTTAQIELLQVFPQYSVLCGILVLIVSLVLLGRKGCAYIQGAISILGWAILFTAQNPTTVYVGCFFITTTVGLSNAAAAIYLSEITTDSRRGRMIALTVFSEKLGKLLAYTLGTFCLYRSFNCVGLIIAAFFPFFLFWVPPTPAELVARGRVDDAAKSYAWVHDVSIELATQHVNNLRNAPEHSFNIRQQLKSKSNRKAIYIMILIFGVMPLAGSVVLKSYPSEIFELAQCSLTPNNAALMIAIVYLFASLLGAVVIDYVGRRRLALIGFIIVATSLYTMAVYFIIQSQNSTAAVSYQWLIYIGFSFYYVAVGMTIEPITQVFAAELVPPGVNWILWMFAGLCSIVTSITASAIYIVIKNHLPYYINFLQQAIFATFLIIIAWYIVPETKGKSLEEITTQLNGKNSDRNVKEEHTQNPENYP